MGFRFSKRISILPGVRLNLSGSGASLSVGPRGASVTMGKRGIYGNVGIPGTGLSYRERLNKPAARNSSRQVPQMPETVIASLNGDQIEFLDEARRPVDPELIPSIKRAMKDDVQTLLENNVAARNTAIELLTKLHHDIPQTVASHSANNTDKPQRASFISQESYMEALMSWRANAANQDLNQEAIENALLNHLGGLEWPYETNIAINLTGSRLLLDVDIPELEDVPTERWASNLTQMSLAPRKISQKDLSALYLEHICSLMMRLIGHSFAASRAINTVGISTYTQRSSSTGRLTDEYVATVEVSRDDWSETDLSALASIDPQNLLRRFSARILTNSRGILLVQDPLK